MTRDLYLVISVGVWEILFGAWKARGCSMEIAVSGPSEDQVWVRCIPPPGTGEVVTA